MANRQQPFNTALSLLNQLLIIKYGDTQLICKTHYMMKVPWAV